MKAIYALALCCPLIAGCGTIFNGGSGPVTIRSDAPSATYSITDRKGKHVATGRSNQQFKLANGSGYMMPGIYTVRASAPGYENTEHKFRAGMSGWYWGNILLGGALGMLIVDPLSGGMWDIEQDVHIPMRKLAIDDVATTAPVSAMAAAATTSKVFGRHQHNAEKAAAAQNCTNTTLASSGPGVELYTAMCGDAPVMVRCEFSNCAVQ